MSTFSNVDHQSMYITIAESVVRTATGSAEPHLVHRIAHVLAYHSLITSRLADSAARGLLSVARMTEMSARAHAATDRAIQCVLAGGASGGQERAAPITAPEPRGRPAEEARSPVPAEPAPTASGPTVGVVSGRH